MFSRYRAYLFLILVVFLILCPAMSNIHKRDEMHKMYRWPGAVGQNAEEAMAIIKRDRPDIKIVAVPEGSMVTMDFITSRVRVFVNEQGNVAKEPMLG
jgi:hypothetical protein